MTAIEGPSSGETCLLVGQNVDWFTRIMTDPGVKISDRFGPGAQARITSGCDLGSHGALDEVVWSDPKSAPKVSHTDTAY